MSNNPHNWGTTYVIIKKKTILHFDGEHTIHMNSKILQNGYGIYDYKVSSRISY
jgi:hypothetical protein